MVTVSTPGHSFMIRKKTRIEQTVVQMLLNMGICKSFLFNNVNKEYKIMRRIELWMYFVVPGLHGFDKHDKGASPSCFS